MTNPSSTHHLAELNIGRLIAEPSAPEVQEFMDNLDLVNGLGKRSQGFVWMMEGSGEPNTGNTENAVNGDPRFVANLTLWEDLASLEAFVWKTVHARFFKRRSAWFEKAEKAHFVMWWVPKGHRPSLDEALAKLEVLRANGASEAAFDWVFARQNFGAAQ